MYRLKEITDKVISEIENGTDYSLIEQLENANSFKISNEGSFKNYILFLLILIEKSKYRETASAILINKIYKDKIYYDSLNKSKEEYGDIFISTIKDGAVFPYVNTSFFLQKLFRSIIYGRGEAEAENIISITPHKKLLDVNEQLLIKYLNDKGIDDDAINIYCNSFYDIDKIVILNKKAREIMRNKILGQGESEQPGLISYLKIFIRPLYSYPSGTTQRLPFYVPEPFYEQTFNSHIEFINILNEARGKYDGDELNLINDILEFLDKYYTTKEEELGHKYVDLDKIRIISRLHEHIEQSDVG